MSRLAIDRLGLPWRQPPLQLDIGRDRLLLLDGKTPTRQKLAAPLHPGLPDDEASAALRSALAALGESVPAGRRTLHVSVSDALARNWIVARLPGLASLPEIESLALDQMQQLYGDRPADAGQWAVRLDAEPFVSGWPAIAIPQALLDSLSEIAAQHDWQLGKIQTRFVASFNALPGRPFGRSAIAVYAQATRDALTIGIRRANEWLALRTHPPLQLLGAELPVMLRRDCTAAGLRLEDCRIHTLHWPPHKAAR